jgi:hypothetical protein
MCYWVLNSAWSPRLLAGIALAALLRGTSTWPRLCNSSQLPAPPRCWCVHSVARLTLGAPARGSLLLLTGGTHSLGEPNAQLRRQPPSPRQARRHPEVRTPKSYGRGGVARPWPIAPPCLRNTYVSESRRARPPVPGAWPWVNPPHGAGFARSARTHTPGNKGGALSRGGAACHNPRVFGCCALMHARCPPSPAGAPELQNHNTNFGYTPIRSSVGCAW